MKRQFKNRTNFQCGIEETSKQNVMQHFHPTPAKTQLFISNKSKRKKETRILHSDVKSRLNQ